MRRGPALLLALGALLAGSVHGQEPWLARAFIPSSNNVHGEVRLLKRGEAACVQTLLYSKYLRRGLHEMTKQERLAWPEGWPCCEASSNYLADLDTVKYAVLGDSTPATNEAPEAKRMLIEFTFSPTGSCHAVGDMDLAGPPEALEVVQTRLRQTREAPPYYISRAMWLMGRRAFAASDEALRALLESAGWRDVDAPELPPAQQFVPR